jgi:hypothetical protein
VVIICSDRGRSVLVCIVFLVVGPRPGRPDREAEFIDLERGRRSGIGLLLYLVFGHVRGQCSPDRAMGKARL